MKRSKLHPASARNARSPVGVDTLFMQGFSLHQKGCLDQAAEIYTQVVEKDPRHFDALHLLGVIAAQSKNPSLAVDLIGRAIRANPNIADAHSNIGAALKQLGRLDEATASYDQAIRLKPDMAEAYSNRGNVLIEMNRLEEAVTSLDRAIALKPDFADACFNRGNALKALNRSGDALASYDRAIELNPNLAQAHYNRGIVLQSLGRPNEAVSSYACAIRLRPDYFDAYCNLGAVLRDLRRREEALAIYQLALRIQPESAAAWCNRGIALYDLGRFEEALASYEQAIRINPDYAQAHANSGDTFQRLQRMDEALACYRRALDLMPDYAEACMNMGSALKELGRLEESLALYDKAIATSPDLSLAYSNRGNALVQMKRLDEALVSYSRALELQPELANLLGTLIHTRHRLCEWAAHEEECGQLASAIQDRRAVSSPFVVATALDAPALQRIAAEVWTESISPPQHVLGPITARSAGSRIRLGYYSADFHDHATCCLMAELFELHDRDRFELFAFSFGPDVRDAIRQRVSQAFDRFIDVRSMSDVDVARLSRELGIDIAVDLKGYTQDARPGIFSYRCAPVQVNYLGYPGTMGAPYMDYLIADKVLIPEESRVHYSEKIAYLPHSYQVNDTKRQIADTPFTRETMGLPKDGFVFCCFNNSFKITPQTFDGWMRILLAVPGSVLWLLDDNAHASQNLRKEAAARGVDPHRLVFGGRLPLPEHLARQRLADLFLDTLPCNAHTTASDALWAGLPVLTLMGQSFAGRVAASLLMAMELPELIAGSQEDYERKAIEWAFDPAGLGALRQKLQENRLVTPLYDTPRFARHIEQAFVQMHARRLAGLPTDHIEISP